MKPKTLGILALVVGALVAFVAFYERKLPSTDERRTLEKKAFGSLLKEADDVVLLELERDGRKVRIERDPKPATGGEGAAPPPARDWRLVEPMSAKADRTLADRLASDLAGLEISRRLDGAQRKDVGLEPPKGVVRWKTPDADGTLEIGGEVPASSNLVVAASGQSSLLVVAKSIAESLTRAPGDWRAKEVVAASREEIERIRLVPVAGEEVVLSRKGTTFVVERPLADAAERDLVDPLLSDLTALRAETFLDASLAPEAEAGLAATAGRIELSVKGKSEPISIELGAPVGGAMAAAAAAAGDANSEGAAAPASDANRYVRVAGQTIEAKTKLAEALMRVPEAWRSKAWTSFDSWKVERIRVEDTAGGIELKRDAGDWLRDGVKIPYTEVGDLLYAITSAHADRLLAGDAARAIPAGAPTATVVFSDANGVEETLTLNAPTADGVPARVSGRDVVLLLPQKAADEVAAKIASVRAAKAVEEKAKDGESGAKATDAGATGTGGAGETTESEPEAVTAPPPR